MSYGLWRDRGYISSVFIKGDILQVFELEVGILQQYGDKKDGNGNTGVSLEDMIIMAGPESSCFNFYIMTSDGRWSFI